MNDYTTYVGMDVHARSIMCKGMCKQTGELHTKLFADNPSSTEVHEWMATLPQPVYSAYESGCTGFWLARELRELGDDCDVIAISTLPRSAKDKQEKRDKFDVEVEAARDLARARQDAVKAVKSAKQKVSSLLLHYHFVWSEKTPTGKLKKTWRGDYRTWWIPND